MQPKEATPEVYRSLADFRYELRKFIHFSEQAARTAGLHPQHHQVLLTIKGLPEDLRPSISVITERLQLQHHSVVELIDRMEESGLVRREKSTHDKRVVEVFLTLKGERVLQSLSLQHLEELQQQAQTLAASLRKIARKGR